MSDTIHHLHDEFPEHAERMVALRSADDAFARLYDEYHEINRQVIAAETLESPTEHFHEEDMKKQRAYLKDEIYRMLTA